MRPIHTIFFIKLCIISLPIFAQWEQVDGDFGNSINDIHYADNIISLACDNGINYSYNQGLTWNKGALGLHSGIAFNSISNIGKSVFATGDSGLFFSSDYKKWNKIKNDYGNVLLSTKSTLLTYNSVANGKIYISRDTGQTWKFQPWNGGILAAGSANSNNFFLGFSKFIGVISYANNAWTQKPYFFPADTLNKRFLKSIDCNDNYICAITSTFPDTLFFSVNSGKTWEVKPIKLPDYYNGHNSSPVEVKLKLIDSNIVITTPKGVYITYDKGESWTKVMAGVQENLFKSISIAGDFLLLGVSIEGGKAMLYRRKLKDFNGITYNGGGMLEAPNATSSTYQWYFNDTMIPDAVERMYSAFSSGTYKVIIKNWEHNASPNFEKNISYSYSYTDVITSTSDTKEITMDTHWENSEGKSKSYCIINNVGQVIREGELIEPIKSYTEKLVAGIYLFKIIENGSSQTYKIVVE